MTVRGLYISPSSNIWLWAAAAAVYAAICLAAWCMCRMSALSNEGRDEA